MYSCIFSLRVRESLGKREREEEGRERESVCDYRLPILTVVVYHKLCNVLTIALTLCTAAGVFSLRVSESLRESEKKKEERERERE